MALTKGKEEQSYIFFLQLLLKSAGFTTEKGFKIVYSAGL